MCPFPSTSPTALWTPTNAKSTHATWPSSKQHQRGPHVGSYTRHTTSLSPCLSPCPCPMHYTIRRSSPTQISALSSRRFLSPALSVRGYNIHAICMSGKQEQCLNASHPSLMLHHGRPPSPSPVASELLDSGSGGAIPRPSSSSGSAAATAAGCIHRGGIGCCCCCCCCCDCARSRSGDPQLDCDDTPSVAAGSACDCGGACQHSLVPRGLIIPGES